MPRAIDFVRHGGVRLAAAIALTAVLPAPGHSAADVGAPASAPSASFVPGPLDPTLAGIPLDPAWPKRVYVMTDSVMLGAKQDFIKSLPQWEVTYAGRPALMIPKALEEVRQIKGTLGPVAVVALGYNSLWEKDRQNFKRWSDFFDKSVEDMIAALEERGARKIVWVLLRELTPDLVSGSGVSLMQYRTYAWYFPYVNERLRAIKLRHPEMALADWASAARQPGITYDAIHLNPRGAELMVTVVKTAMGVDAPPATPAPSPKEPVVEASIALDRGASRIQVVLTNARNPPTRQPDPPEATVHAHLLEAAEQARLLEAAVQAHSRETAAQVHPPQASLQAHPPQAPLQAHPPESAVQVHPPQVPLQAHLLEAALQAHLLEAALQDRPPEAALNGRHIDFATAVVLGDSLTAKGPWSELTGCRFVANAGVEHGGSGEILKRLDEITRFKPRDVFLMAGLDDLISAIPTTDIAQHVRQIVEQLTRSGIHVYLELLPPVVEGSLRPLKAQVDSLNAAYQALSSETGASLIDFRTQMQSERGDLRKDVSLDGQHLTLQGYRIWSEALMPYLRRDCPESPTVEARATLQNPSTRSAIDPLPTASIASPPSSADPKDWLIQVGAYPEEERAKERIRLAKSLAEALLADADPLTEKVVDGKKAMYRARFDKLTQTAATAACVYFKSKDIDCIAGKD